ncbi:hypothetical protein HDU87_001444 [Geranomyces variabilis]|uniref:HTH La-type RNA-binding domain-containing protein n=1 Tax=Geranomyces variabilis TaxID=109894 RepID=A0AAD5TCR9_9FUNG|nr:hypothetical protein HDU87_001444 [Geranomyces variabilis]
MGFHKRPPSEEELQDAILKQVEYYFGDQNYPKDTHLHQIAALHGNWVPIRVLCTFKKLRALSDSVKFVSAALIKSPALLELSKDGKNVRRRNPPTKEEPSLKRERADDKEVSEGPAKKPRTQDPPTGHAVGPRTTASVLAAFHSRHFGAAARQRFPVPSPATAVDDSDYWSRLCGPCAEYWTDYCKHEQQPDAAVNGGASHSHALQEDVADADAAYLTDAQGEENNNLSLDADFKDDEKEEESLLTPGMIAIFRHSENWKREKAAYYAELERKEQEELAAESEAA